MECSASNRSIRKGLRDDPARDRYRGTRLWGVALAVSFRLRIRERRFSRFGTVFEKCLYRWSKIQRGRTRSMEKNRTYRLYRKMIGKTECFCRGYFRIPTSSLVGNLTNTGIIATGRCRIFSKSLYETIATRRCVRWTFCCGVVYDSLRSKEFRTPVESAWISLELFAFPLRCPLFYRGDCPSKELSNGSLRRFA